MTLKIAQVSRAVAELRRKRTFTLIPDPGKHSAWHREAVNKHYTNFLESLESLNSKSLNSLQFTTP